MSDDQEKSWTMYRKKENDINRMCGKAYNINVKINEIIQQYCNIKNTCNATNNKFNNINVFLQHLKTKRILLSNMVYNLNIHNDKNYNTIVDVTKQHKQIDDIFHQIDNLCQEINNICQYHYRDIICKFIYIL